jgi:cystathionine beta-synthase
MVEQAEAEGRLRPGGTIVEASSGNQGLALAMVGAVKGYRVIITVKAKVSTEKRQAIEAYGAEVVACSGVDDHDDPTNYYARAIQITRETPGAVFMDQHYNLANPEAHYRGLGPELWRQTAGRITHYIAAAGTGGQVSGAGHYLKEQNPGVRVIAVDAATSWHATGGQPEPYRLEGIGLDFETECLNEAVVDEFVPVSDEQGLGMLRELATGHGLLVGPSSGAVAYAARRIARDLKPGDLAVAVFSDSGRAYLSKNYYGKEL